MGRQEHVANAAGALAGGHLGAILHATRRASLPTDELAAIREHTRTSVVLLASGEASALELVDAAIARTEALNPQLNAVIHELFEDARELAEGDLPDGPFRGVPFLFKDLGAALAGQPLHVGMELLKKLEFRSPVDTFLGQRFRDAGFVNTRVEPIMGGLVAIHSGWKI